MRDSALQPMVNPGVRSLVPAAFTKIENFFANLNVGESPAPTLADMDDDGDLDLLVGLSGSGHVK